MVKPVARKPLWNGPDKDGITQSLLGKFLECRERFRLRVVEGLSEDEGFSRPLEFGNFWHAAEEAYLGQKSWESAIQKYRRLLERRYPTATDEVMKWYKVCKTQFPIYLKFWEHQRDEKFAKPILEECSFAVPYTLPSGRMVLLRGKWDALRLLPLCKGKPTKKTEWGIYIKEHKTKGEIDEEGILKTLAWNMQTMMYQIALREMIRTGEMRFLSIDRAGPLIKAITAGCEAAGVIYNVVRRPLSDRYAIKQRKAESIDAFYRRLGKEQIAADPKHYFMRWKVEIDEDDIQQFKTRTFHPILESLLDWWEHIQRHPFDPFCADDGDSTFFPHWQSPWGVHNSLAGGFRGSFFEYLTTGRDYNLVPINTLFPELVA